MNKSETQAGRGPVVQKKPEVWLSVYVMNVISITIIMIIITIPSLSTTLSAIIFITGLLIFVVSIITCTAASNMHEWPTIVHALKHPLCP